MLPSRTCNTRRACMPLNGLLCAASACWQVMCPARCRPTPPVADVLNLCLLWCVAHGGELLACPVHSGTLYQREGDNNAGVRLWLPPAAVLACPSNAQLMKLGSGVLACSAGLRLGSSTAQAQPLRLVRCAVQALIGSNVDGLVRDFEGIHHHQRGATLQH